MRTSVRVLQQQLEEARREAYAARRENEDLRRQLESAEKRARAAYANWGSATNEIKRLQAALGRRKA